MGHPLDILVLGLISVSQLWEGVQSNGYKIYLPDALYVQKGLCVAIPCFFTYPESHRNLSGPLYGYWYEDTKKVALGPLVATNDPGKEIVQGARGRFRLSENLEQGNCSLFVTDVQHSDQKDYFFRMQKGDGYSYFPATSVRVTETPKPKIQILGKLRAGQPVKLTCTAARCPWKSPQISWEFTRNISGILSSLSKGNNISSFVTNFVPSEADNDQFLTCRVIYGSGSMNPVISEKRIYLNVSYAPLMPQISGELKRPNQSSQSFTDILQMEVREGDTLQLHCEAEGNPLPRVAWVKKWQPITQHSVSVNQLMLYNVKLQDMGRYTCWAQNTEGSSKATFQVYMAQTHQTIMDESIIVPFFLGFSLIKVVFCFMIFSCIIWFSNRRKPPVMGEESRK